MTALPDVGDDFGAFRIVDVIGGSAMGKVYAATRGGLGEVEALKVLAPSWIDADDYRDRFLRDTRTLARLGSSHIVDIHEYGDVDGTPYVATDFVRGGDLGRYLQERGRLPAELAIEIASHVASALEDAHAAGVIHANLKPSNVLLRGHGDPFASLCDFGIARSESGGQTTATVMGTWAYLAPERCSGGEATVASDVYAVGCLLWAMLTGEAPYRGTDLEVATAHLRDPVPQLDGDDEWTVQANAVLARTLSKSPDDRFVTAGELRLALEDLPNPPGERDLPPAPAGAHPDPATPLAEPTAVSGDAYAGRSPSPRKIYEPGRRSLALLAVGVLVVVAAVAVLLNRSTDTDAADRSTDPSPSASRSAAPSPSPSASSSAAPSGPSSTATASRSTRSATGATRRLTAAQLARLTRVSYAGGSRSLVSVRSLDGRSGDVRAFGLVGTRFVVGSSWRLPAAGANARGVRSRLAGDFDGDHKTDEAIVQGEPNGTRVVLVARSTGKGFAAARRWGTIPRSAAARTSIITGDFDGDGHMDIAVVKGRTSGSSLGVTVLLSTGTRFRPPISWTPSLPWDGRYVKLEPGDFNADGRTDLVAFVGDSRRDAIQVRMLLSNGKRFSTPARSWFSGTLPTTDMSAIRPVTGDFNGDGSTDVMLFTPEFFTGNLEALLFTSDGRQLTRASVPWWTSDRWTLSGTRMSVGDFDHNGRADIACLVDGGTRGVGLRFLLASGSALEPKAAVTLPKRSFSQTGVLDTTG